MSPEELRRLFAESPMAMKARYDALSRQPGSPAMREAFLRRQGVSPRPLGTNNYATERNELDRVRQRRADALLADPMIGEGEMVSGAAAPEPVGEPQIRQRELAGGPSPEFLRAAGIAPEPAQPGARPGQEPSQPGPGQPAEPEQPGWFAQRRNNFDNSLSGIAAAFANNPNPSWGQIGAAMAGGAATGRQTDRENALRDRQIAFQENYYNSRAAADSAEGEAKAAELARQEEFLKTLPAEQQALLRAYPDLAKDILKPQDPAEAPTVKDFFQGGETVQKQWDPAQNAWVEIGRGARWAPPQASAPSVPTTREFPEGDQLVTKQWDGTKWVPLGSAPRWQTDKGGEGEGGGATIQERNRNLLTSLGLKIKNGGYESLTAEERATLERVYREEAAPKITVDPITGAVSRNTPDMSDIVIPPSMAGWTGPTADSGSPSPTPPPNLPPQPTGTPPGAPPPSAIAGTAGSPSAQAAAELKYGPRGGAEIVENRATREQLGAVNSAITARSDMTSATGRMRDLLKEGNGSPALFGDRAKRMEVTAQQIVTALGALGNAGVLQPSDIARFTEMFGNPTSATEYLKSQAGMGTIGAALDELDRTVEERLRNRASEANLPRPQSKEERDALPPGSLYLAPDGTVARKS